MDIGEIIAKKRDRGKLGEAEIGRVVSGFVRGEVGEGPMAALLMAVALNGMTSEETAALTLAMAESGERLDLSAIPGVKVDKHSTGGVGDKTTLVVAPLVAALGVPVPKMSGRSLGHTGGTIEKLEAVPGLSTDLAPDRFCAQVGEIGVAIASQTENMVPADKKIYALRDATATVESIPLIAASVMSKKLAVGADAIVLDVKVGAGAFMRHAEDARRLARTMVEIGSLAGRKMVALITRMEQPLGAAVGDAAELAEAIQTLDGQGPPDLVQLCEIVAGHMLALGGAAASPEAGAARAHQALASGLGREKLRQMVAAQGGEVGAVDEPESLLAPAVRVPVELGETGFVAAVEARRIGLAVRHLKEAAGDRRHICGVLLQRKTGESLRGEPAAFVLAPPEAGDAIGRTLEEVRAAYAVRDAPSPSLPLVAEVVAG
jgi:pyrimidine-nucleoside phosphorylase